jgi:hypothetical protein
VSKEDQAFEQWYSTPWTDKARGASKPLTGEVYYSIEDFLKAAFLAGYRMGQGEKDSEETREK